MYDINKKYFFKKTTKSNSNPYCRDWMLTLQEEVHKEVERDANLLKARQKLDKYAKGDWGA